MRRPAGSVGDHRSRRLRPLAEVRARQARERQRAEQQAEVAQGDVAVAADEQQADDDAAQPSGDEQTAEARRGEDDDARDDLDHADEVHGVLGRAGQDVVELGGQVLRPVVGEDLGELVEAEQDRRDGEGDPQQQERLRGGIAAQRIGLGSGIGRR